MPILGSDAYLARRHWNDGWEDGGGVPRWSTHVLSGRNEGGGGLRVKHIGRGVDVFPRFQLLSHYGLETKARGGNEWTHKERMIWRRALFMLLSGFDLELFGLLRAER